MAAGATETLQIVDGTTMEVTRAPDVDDAMWSDLKAYVEGSSETARALRHFAANADALRGWLQTQAIAEHYGAKLASGDRFVLERMRAMEEDPELAPVLRDVRRGGLEAAAQRFHDEDLMLKFSRKMGGLPEDLSAVLEKLDNTPLSLHEAAKKGDLHAVQEFLDKNRPVDARDHKGVTPLGYAVGASRVAVVKLLLDHRADPRRVDKADNSGLHYAAGYGRKELVKYFLKTGSLASQTNAQGQTPLAVAKLNRRGASVKLLQAHSAW